jgi:hypothetical protein
MIGPPQPADNTADYYRAEIERLRTLNAELIEALQRSNMLLTLQYHGPGSAVAPQVQANLVILAKAKVGQRK